MPKIIASFDVDPQKTFTNLLNELPIDGGGEIVTSLNEQAELATYRVACREAHLEDSLFEAKSKDEEFTPVHKQLNIDIKWKRHGIHGSEGWELLPGLPHPVNGYDFMATKGMDRDSHPYGGCYNDQNDKQSTGVIEWLKYRNVSIILIGGLALDFCVFRTVQQLSNAGFEVIVNIDACRGVDPESTRNAIAEMAEMKGVLIQDNAKEIKNYFFINLGEDYAQ
jgi:nicotinamidase/pyrazinamidase